MMSRLQTVLGIRRDNGAKSLRELALQFRCTGFLEFIKSTLKTYKERFIRGLPQQRQAHAQTRKKAELVQTLIVVRRRSQNEEHVKEAD